MRSYLVSIHLPKVNTSYQRGLVGVVTPSGIVETRMLNAKAVKQITDPVAYAAEIIGRMYPAVHNKIIDVEVILAQTTNTSAQLHVIKVSVLD